MPFLVERAVLPVSSRILLRYSVSRDPATRADPTPLLVCLHPGWSGEAPPPYYGEEFLSSIFVPAFAGTGAIIACPDCPCGAWNNQRSQQAIFGLVDHLVTSSAADRQRVSLAGYSAGGWGVWYLLQHSPLRFASSIVLAAPPVIDPVDTFEENFSKMRELLAGRLDEWIERIPEIPIYIIHSQDDELLPWEGAWIAYEALLQARTRAECHPINGVGHFQGEGYIPALADSSAWLVDTWRASDRSSRSILTP